MMFEAMLFEEKVIVVVGVLGVLVLAAIARKVW